MALPIADAPPAVRPLWCQAPKYIRPAARPLSLHHLLRFDKAPRWHGFNPNLQVVRLAAYASASV